MTNAVNLASAAATGFMRNRIINGAMVIDQRNAGASVTPTDGSYTLDRWQVRQTVASKFSVQQNAASVTPPTGFTNYLGVTSLSAYSIGSSDLFAISQHIEGFNTADFGWGTAAAQTVTLSFWVRSSLTGTFGGSLRNVDGGRQYPFSFSVSAANTWEYKTVTITGDTSGTWATGNTTGIRLSFGLGAGSTFSATAGAWGSTGAWSATGATSVVGTNGATFYITGVQLEVGSVATPFEREIYSTTLAKCQRYYEKTYSTSVVPATATPLGSITFIAYVAAETTGAVFKVSKRAVPTVTLYTTAGTSGQIGGPANAATAGYIADSGFGYIGRTGNTVGSGYYGHFTADAEL